MFDTFKEQFGFERAPVETDEVLLVAGAREAIINAATFGVDVIEMLEQQRELDAQAQAQSQTEASVGALAAQPTVPAPEEITPAPALEAAPQLMTEDQQAVVIEQPVAPTVAAPQLTVVSKNDDGTLNQDEARRLLSELHQEDQEERHAEAA